MMSVSDQKSVLLENILSVSESVLWCATYIFVLCLFCLVGQNNCWNYFAFSWTRSVEVVTRQVWNTCPVQLTMTSAASAVARQPRTPRSGEATIRSGPTIYIVSVS